MELMPYAYTISAVVLGMSDRKLYGVYKNMLITAGDDVYLWTIYDVFRLESRSSGEMMFYDFIVSQNKNFHR